MTLTPEKVNLRLPVLVTVIVFGALGDATCWAANVSEEAETDASPSMPVPVSVVSMVPDESTVRNVPV